VRQAIGTGSTLVGCTRVRWLNGIRLFACAAAFVVVAAAGAASDAIGPPPPPTALVLAPDDLGPGTSVVFDRTIKLGGAQIFLRLYKGAKVGGRPVIAVSEAFTESDADAATSEFEVMHTELGLRILKGQLASVFAAALEGGAKVGSHGKATLTVTKTVISRPISVAKTAFRLAVTFWTNKGPVRGALGFVQTDRAIGIVFLLPVPARKLLGAGNVARVVAAEQRRLEAAFTVASTAAPTITGTAQQGQTLTLAEGTWSGAPSTFAYAWSRCDANGNACTPIAAATAKTYVPSAADSGAMLKAVVTGSNSVSSGQASSAPTAVVA
jgi:hypothetical protein